MSSRLDKANFQTADEQWKREAVMEESAGCVLVRRAGISAQALVIRVRKEDFEIPKGHVEPGEAKDDAALRELREETGLRSAVVVVANVGVLDYSFEQNGASIRKRVTYFAVTSAEEDLNFDAKPARTRELRWVSAHDLDALPLVNEALRAIIRESLSALEK